MTVLEVEIDLADWPMTWERDAGPFRLALLRRGLTIAEAPIGIWRFPNLGERLTSAWPAKYEGPLKSARRWELRSPNDDRPVAGGSQRMPRLWRLDTMTVTVTLVGR